MAIVSHSRSAQPPQRATQGFVENLSWLRSRPGLVLLEVLWRWCFGIPAALLLYREASRVLGNVPWRATGVQDISANQLLTDPAGVSTMLANFAAVVGPDLYRSAAWLVPTLLVAWAVVSGLGRTAVLRRMDTRLVPRPVTLMLLQLARLLPLVAAGLAWWFGLRLLADRTILRPLAAGGEPRMMTYVGGAIVLTLGLFVLSAAVSWIFSIAPLMAMLRNQGAARSLRDAMHVGSLRSALVEINMVLSIVKIALLVLAMVFSACPLPFQSVTTDEFLLWWTIAVAVWYFLASDFFHVARLSAYLHLWQTTAELT